MASYQETRKQLEKLDLEIKGLRKKNRWVTAVQLMQIFATPLAIAGLIFAIVQFTRQQAAENRRIADGQQKERMTRRLEQTARFQNQIRADIDEVLRFTRDDRQTLSRVSFLLGDMKTVLGSRVDDNESVSDIFPGYERSLTESLVHMVLHDCDFIKNRRDVGLANMVVLRWPDYSSHLRQNSRQRREEISYMLYAYTRALQGLRDQVPGYVESFQVDRGGNVYSVSRKYEMRKDEAALYSHFWAIVAGFRLHINILGDDEDAASLKEGCFEEFRAAMHNPAVSDHILTQMSDNQRLAKGQ